MKKKLPFIARILLGLPFVIFGLNGFFHFLPMPPMADKPAAFFAGLMASGYFLPVLFGTQFVCGVLLVSGVFVPLALMILAPILIQIDLFHFFLESGGTGMALFFSALEIYLAFFAEPYAPTVKRLFRSRT